MKPNAFLLHSPYNTSLPKEYDVSWKQNLIEKLLLCFSNQIYIYDDFMFEWKFEQPCAHTEVKSACTDEGLFIN